MTRASLLLTFSILAAQTEVARWRKCSQRRLGLPRAAAPFSTSSLHSPLWDNEITAFPGESPTPSRRRRPPAGCPYEKESVLQNPSLDLTWVSLIKTVSLLNEQNNTLKPLTSAGVLHRITAQLQCDYRLTESEQRGLRAPVNDWKCTARY